MSLIKKFKINLKKISGRNIHGRICVFHKGGGNKKLYTKLDFYRRINCFGIIHKIINTKYHTALIGVILYENGLMCNSILAEDSELGDIIFSGSLVSKEIEDKIEKGSTIPLNYITLFNLVSNIESHIFKGANLLRAAGTSALYIERDNKQSTLKMPSGWLIRVDNNCLVTLGKTSNPGHKYEKIKKAGINRNRGIRPTVRGVAKNPCDHPHGGGEGKASPPVAAVSPWGKLTKGTPTTKKLYHILKRREFKKVNV